MTCLHVSKIKGDVITTEPSYKVWNNQASAFGLNFKRNPLPRNVKQDIEKLYGPITSQTRMIYICNPNNPTGTALERNDVEQFAINASKQTLVFIDEAYAEYAQLKTLAPIAINNPNIIVAKTFSKVLKRLEKSTARLVAVNDQLNDAEKTIKRVDATLTGLDEKQSAPLKKLNTAMTDSIKNIRDYIFGKKQEKQGYGTPYQVTVNGRLQEANAAVAGKNKIPDAQEVRLTEEAEFLVSDVVLRANNFLSTKWKDYRNAVESSQIKLFKEVKMIE